MEHPGSVPKEPDADTIKLFIGQIPRTYTEVDCMKLFDEFGPVYQLNIHRDKETGESKGCCFVTFYHRADAMKAQGALHNTKILPGMHNPMQVKPADAENRNERKLFVGMLSRTATEDDVKELFDPFGTIEEVTVLRDSATGRSRGCAFVTFVSRSCAHQAIRQMHQSRTFEGCTKPMVVKLADTTKDKDSKKGTQSPNESTVLQLLQGNGLTGNVTNQLTSLGVLLQNPGVATLLGTVIASLTSAATTAGASNASGISSSGGEPGSSKKLTPSNGTAELNEGGPGLTPLVPTSGALLSQVASYSALTQPATLASSTTGIPFVDPNLNLVQRQLPILSTGIVEPNMVHRPASGSNMSKGPEGCNLFIYHLPQEFGDDDLRNLFAHFGTVLSAKVYIDKQTNLSKCFGFVSFDNPANAQSAINGMNGFQIGSKRLKVALKKSDKPYNRNSP